MKDREERASALRAKLRTIIDPDIISNTKLDGIIKLVEDSMVEHQILKEAIIEIKEMDNTRYDTKRFVVATEDQVDQRCWWLREPIVHETYTTKASYVETLERLRFLEKYGQSQAFMLVPIDLNKHMES